VIPNGLVVELSVVDAETPSLILFLDKDHRQENAEVLEKMIPWASITTHWVSSSSFRCWGYRYGRMATGGVAGWRWMRWSKARLEVPQYGS
jgi:hypothetical protein